jgi:hypothetical protein
MGNAAQSAGLSASAAAFEPVCLGPNSSSFSGDRDSFSRVGIYISFFLSSSSTFFASAFSAFEELPATPLESADAPRSSSKKKRRKPRKKQLKKDVEEKNLTWTPEMSFPKTKLVRGNKRRRRTAKQMEFLPTWYEHQPILGSEDFEKIFDDLLLL